MFGPRNSANMKYTSPRTCIATTERSNSLGITDLHSNPPMAISNFINYTALIHFDLESKQEPQSKP